MAAIVVLATMSGCAKLTKTKAADVAFFADTTIALVGQSESNMSRDDAVYTREYFDFDGEEEKTLLELADEIRFYKRALITYSLDLVTISETGASEEDRVALYAVRLDKLDEWVEQNLNLETKRYSYIVESVREQSRFLGALNEAQPIINAIGRYAEFLLAEVEVATDALILMLEQRIDDRYAPLAQFREDLWSEKQAVLQAMRLLSLARNGDSEALDDLRVTDAVRQRPPAGSPDTSGESFLAETEGYLRGRLDEVYRLEEKMQVDWDAYRAVHRELNEIRKELVAARNRSRLLFLVWVRAHKKMASGTVTPAEWFSIEDVPATLLSAGARVVL